ncbi:hypothetical protein [Syntrophaceticus schinkii]|uniref:hypothetical protein n=1 Tax=Syntrophaceticus schinkii TaxID=499207 RepID=UPI0018DC6CEA|nr:hypothetical protein [Syntrophaceticus schinkii]
MFLVGGGKYLYGGVTFLRKGKRWVCKKGEKKLKVLEQKSQNLKEAKSDDTTKNQAGIRPLLQTLVQIWNRY